MESRSELGNAGLATSAPEDFATAFNSLGLDLQLSDTKTHSLANDQLTKELSVFYGGIETEDYSATHLPRPGATVHSGSFSSLTKWSHFLAIDENALGIAVFTAKRTGALKVGPIWIDRRYRNRGYTRKLLDGLPDAAAAIGSSRVVVSVSEFNWPMISSLTRASYAHSHTLVRHYSDRHDEYVYVKASGASTYDRTTTETPPTEGNVALDAVGSWVERHFFRFDSGLHSWVNAASRRPPSLEEAFMWRGDGAYAIMMPKRGGTVSVIPCVPNPKDWGSTIEAILQAATEIAARKLSILTPQEDINSLLKAAAQKGSPLILEAILSNSEYTGRSTIVQLASHRPTASRHPYTWC